MPVWLHICLDTVVSLLGVALWWALIIAIWPFDALERTIHSQGLRGALLIVTCALGFGVGLLLSRWFRRIPARCRNCGGKSFAKGNRPLRYQCEDCGFLESTNVRNNWGPK